MPEEQKNSSESMPDIERRQLLKKLAAAGVVVPAAFLLIDGVKNVSFAY